MNNSITVAVILALIVGGGGGYVVGKSSVGSQSSKEMQDAIVMMKDQSTMIKQGGMSLQDACMRYKDDSLVQKGKDLQVIGEKYLNEDTSRSTEGDMGKMMMTQ